MESVAIGLYQFLDGAYANLLLLLLLCEGVRGYTKEQNNIIRGLFRSVRVEEKSALL